MGKDIRMKDQKPMKEHIFDNTSKQHKQHEKCVDKNHDKKVYTQVSYKQKVISFISSMPKTKLSMETPSLTRGVLR